MRITLLGTAWLFVSYQQTHKQYFVGLTPQVFADYLSYMLGEFVLGLTAKDCGNRSFAAPPWPLIISYEQAVRSKALSLVRKGALLKDAFRQAWEDPVTKDRHFTTPLCLESSRKRTADFAPPTFGTGPHAEGRRQGELRDDHARETRQRLPLRLHRHAD